MNVTTLVFLGLAVVWAIVLLPEVAPQAGREPPLRHDPVVQPAAVRAGPLRRPLGHRTART